MDENLAEVKQSATSNNNQNVLKDSSTQATISTKQKSSSTSTRSKSTTSKDTNNPHSAQTKLNQFLSQPNNMPHQDRMQELQEIAAAKAAKRLEKAKANSQKKKAKAATKYKPNIPEDNTDDDIQSTDETHNNKRSKTKQKTQKASSTASSNYYDPLKKISHMSKTERRQHKQIQRAYRTYFGVKLDIPDNDDGTTTMIKQTALLFTELQRIDPKAIIYAYDDDIPIHAIRTPQDLPDNNITFREFFLNAYPREQKGFIWTTIWLGHDKSTDFILENMKIWSKMKSSLIFAKPLQVKKSVRDYFLLWSTGRMDKDKLHDGVTAAIKSFTKTQYQFAFSWIALKNSDGNYLRLAKKELNGNQFVKALHIEVPEDDRDTTYKVMEIIFGIDSEFKILGTTMLMVPIIREDLPSHKIENIQHLVVKQKQFLDQLYFSKTTDIAELDYKHPALGKSMRDMIMGLKTLDGKGKLIFRGIDKAEKGEAHYLAYPRFLQEQARDVITQLPSLLTWLYGPPALEMMTVSAQARANNAPWNPQEMRAISEEDRTLKRMLNRAKKMSMYNDSDSELSSSDDDIDERQIQLEFEKQANEEYLFSKATTNASITSLGTKEHTIVDTDMEDATNDSIDQDDEVSNIVQDDDSTVTASDKPSPSKKQRQSDVTIDMDPSLIANMMRYFEDHNIDVSTLEAASVTKVTAVATASLHNEEPIATDTSHTVPLVLVADSTHAQDREPSHEDAVPPEPVTGSGDGL